MFVQLVGKLAEAGELSKNEAKLQGKMKVDLPTLATGFGLRFYVGEMIKAKGLNSPA